MHNFSEIDFIEISKFSRAYRFAKDGILFAILSIARGVEERDKEKRNIEGRNVDR